MSKARLVLTALLVEQQSARELAERYGAHRGWVQELNARYEAEGEAAFEPCSRRPRISPTAIPGAVVDLIVRLRKELASNERCPQHLSRAQQRIEGGPRSEASLGVV